MDSHTLGSSGFAELDDARRLHYMASGEGPLTVVFESGMGYSRSCWGLVQPAVAEHTRAVVYDRAGTGRSDVDTAPRTLERMAVDLGALLDHLGPGPFVLVGHSWGGPIVRTVAAADPGRIRGLVLVDPTDENCELYFAPATRRSFALSRAITPFLARTGLYRLIASGPGRVQPADVAADHRDDDFGVAAAAAMVAELTPFYDDLGKLRAHPPRVDALEVSVISGGRASRLERNQRTAIRAAHRETVAGLASARLVEAAASGHLVMFDEPGIIVDEVLGMTT